MSGGLLARLRFWAPPRREDDAAATEAPAERIEASGPPIDEPPADGAAGPAVDQPAGAQPVEQDLSTAEPADQPAVPSAESLASVPARPLPSFRPATTDPASPADVEPGAASPLSLTLSEAIEI